MGRVYSRTAIERARLVAEQRSSGKTQIAWCEERGISRKTFSRWSCCVRRGKYEDRSAVDWMEVDGRDLTPGLSSVTNADIEILVGAYTVRVKPGFDREAMLDICGMLGKIC
jgi:hypothetical protein